jgi:uracil-DNA glycosylase
MSGPGFGRPPVRWTRLDPDRYQTDNPCVVMALQGSARVYVPRGTTLARLRSLAAECTACDLYKRGTQTVFGEGAAHAPLMLIGEQPGDREDLSGRPFVGPAGRLLDEALIEASISRTDAYVTNAVKHFKWIAWGKRRIHEKPSGRERQACYPWLEAEIEIVAPRVLVCLGATAAQSLLGSGFRLTQHRGELLPSRWRAKILATVHPSSLLRIADGDERHAAYRAFVEDLVHANTFARRQSRRS